MIVFPPVPCRPLLSNPITPLCIFYPSHVRSQLLWLPYVHTTCHWFPSLKKKPQHFKALWKHRDTLGDINEGRIWSGTEHLCVGIDKRRKTKQIHWSTSLEKGVKDKEIFHHPPSHLSLHRTCAKVKFLHFLICFSLSPLCLSLFSAITSFGSRSQYSPLYNYCFLFSSCSFSLPCTPGTSSSNTPWHTQKIPTRKHRRTPTFTHFISLNIHFRLSDVFWWLSCSQPSRFPENCHVGSGGPGIRFLPLPHHLGRDKRTAAIDVPVHSILFWGFCLKIWHINFPDNIPLFKTQPAHKPCSLINADFNSWTFLWIHFILLTEIVPKLMLRKL